MGASETQDIAQITKSRKRNIRKQESKRKKQLQILMQLYGIEDDSINLTHAAEEHHAVLSFNENSEATTDVVEIIKNNSQSDTKDKINKSQKRNLKKKLQKEREQKLLKAMLADSAIEINTDNDTATLDLTDTFDNRKNDAIEKLVGIGKSKKRNMSKNRQKERKRQEI